MGRKSESILDFLAEAPWWVSVVVAGMAFVILRYILPGISSENLGFKVIARAAAAVIPIPVYERLVAERQTRFEVIERVRSRVPNASLEEIETDVRQAVAKVRSRRAAGRS